MKIEYGKKFLKELSLIPSKYRIIIEDFVFEELPRYKNIYECKQIESMKGYKMYFKVRFGDYRIGIKKEGEIIIILRVLHRKEIYKYFP